MDSSGQPPSNEVFSQRDPNLSSLFQRNKELIIKLVNNREIEDVQFPKSISKTDLRDQLEDLLEKGILLDSDIASIVEQLQGWGHQQIYLYRVNIDETELPRWLGGEYVESRFKVANLLDIFNRARPVDSADELSLFECKYSQHDGHMRFKWAEVVGALDRRAEDDIKKPFTLNEDGTRIERMVYHAFLESYAQDISTFEWDIQEKIAVFMIRKQSNRSYKDVRDQMIEDLKHLLPIEPKMRKFVPLELRKLLRNLDDNEEIHKRRLRFESTHNRGKITLSSGDIQDIFADEILLQAYNSFVADADRLGGSVSWPLEGRKPIGVYIQARDQDDQRIGIAAQALEEDIRSVLQGIKRNST